MSKVVVILTDGTWAVWEAGCRVLEVTEEALAEARLTGDKPEGKELQYVAVLHDR